jgi:hypothetical protein
VGADGVVEHLLPPEYHGDPTNGTGCLCFYHYGWDLLEAIREAGFRDATVVAGWSIALGHIEPVNLIVAQR